MSSAFLPTTFAIPFATVPEEMTNNFIVVSGLILLALIDGTYPFIFADKLPSGSYCNFQSNFCHWYNYDTGNSSGQWLHVDGSGAADAGYLAVAFKGVHRFATLTYLKSPEFEPIPLYHSMASSKYHKSCRVSVIGH